MVKYLQASLLLMAGIMALLISWTNYRYPAANRAYISHTLTMDTTTEGPHRTRTVTSWEAVILAHWAIILAEALTGLLCLIGGLLYPIHSVGRVIGLAGLTSGIAIWFGGFRILAGEYFCGWQSREWNGLPDAHRISAMLALFWLMIK